MHKLTTMLTPVMNNYIYNLIHNQQFKVYILFNMNIFKYIYVSTYINYVMSLLEL